MFKLKSLYFGNIIINNVNFWLFQSLSSVDIFIFYEFTPVLINLSLVELLLSIFFLGNIKYSFTAGNLLSNHMLVWLPRKQVQTLAKSTKTAYSTSTSYQCFNLRWKPFHIPRFSKIANAYSTSIWRYDIALLNKFCARILSQLRYF